MSQFYDGGGSDSESEIEVTATSITPFDSDAETALRPRSLDEFVGQDSVREQLRVVLSAAKARDEAPDHLLFAGPPGLGKTSLAMIVAAEVNGALRLTSGPALVRAGHAVGHVSPGRARQHRHRRDDGPDLPHASLHAHALLPLRP